MKKIRVGLVGSGQIAQIAHIPCLKKIEDVDLIAICDVDKAKINYLTQKFNIPQGYFVIDEMIKKAELDAVIICTPTIYHFPMSYLALSEGLHVFVEKPIALNAEDAGKLLETSEQNKQILMVGMNNRFREDVVSLKQYIDSKELGEIFYIKAGWLKKWEKHVDYSWFSEKKTAGGGVLMDMGIQLLDLAFFIMDMPDVTKARLFDYYLNPNIDVEDAILAVVETKKGTTITIETSWKMFLEKDTIYTHIFGTKGSAKLNPLRINKEMHNTLVNVSPLMYKSRVDLFKKSYEKELKHFINAIKEGNDILSPAQDAVKIMQIIDALYESAKSKKEVYL